MKMTMLLTGVAIVFFLLGWKVGRRKMKCKLDKLTNELKASSDRLAKAVAENEPKISG